jgi:hypothetical protein
MSIINESTERMTMNKETKEGIAFIFALVAINLGVMFLYMAIIGA